MNCDCSDNFNVDMIISEALKNYQAFYKNNEI